MLAELSKLYQSSETRRVEMLTFVGSLSDANRTGRAAPSEWSPLQVSEHLVLYEELMLDWVNAARNARTKVSLKGRVFVGLMAWLMRSRLRIPTLPELQPRGKSDFFTLKQRWDAARDGLAAKLEAVAKETQTAPFALHPIAGALNAKQSLELLDTHLAYHLSHLPRIKAIG